MEILRVEGITKVYGKGDNQVTALDSIHFSVEKGEFVAIVGASGSGKSTLLHLLGGVDKPSSGKIFIEEQEISSMKEKDLAELRRTKVALIYQFYNLLPVLTVKENMELPSSLDKKTMDEKWNQELLSFLGLEKRKDHLPSELSGGEQQRVAIGRALSIKPSLLLADEATGNLDSKSAAEIINLFKEINQKYGQTILMVTHNFEQAKQANRIIQIKDGKIVSDTKETETKEKVELQNDSSKEETPKEVVYEEFI